MCICFGLYCAYKITLIHIDPLIYYNIYNLIFWYKKYFFKKVDFNVYKCYKSSSSKQTKYYNVFLCVFKCYSKNVFYICKR